jgi:hypothetical protein
LGAKSDLLLLVPRLLHREISFQAIDLSGKISIRVDQKLEKDQAVNP